MAEQKPLLVFLHGWAYDNSIWAGLTDCFENDFRIMAPNIYDFFPLFAERLAGEIAKAADDAPVYVIAWSMGYLAALDIAAFVPVQKIAALSALPCFTTKHGMKKETIDAMVDRLTVNPERTLRKFYQWVDYPERRQPQPSCETAVPLLQQSLAYLAEEDKSSMAASVPTLYLFGEKDAVLPIRAITDFPAINSYIFPEGSHAFFIENRQETTRQINDFFTGEKAADAY